MRAEKGQSKIKLQYWNAGVYAVYKNGILIEPTEWDKEAGSKRELTGYSGCGENRFVGVKNFLEFIITAGCELEVRPVDAIVSNIRMEWTLDEFYGAGGVTSFVDRVSGALGIHASQMKVVAVYTGSVAVDYSIEPASDSTDSAKELRSLNTALDLLVSDGSAAFGAPVLSASADGEALLEDPNYNPAVAAPVTTPIVEDTAQP